MSVAFARSASMRPSSRAAYRSDKSHSGASSGSEGVLKGAFMPTVVGMPRERRNARNPPDHRTCVFQDARKGDSMTYRIDSLPLAPFRPLFEMSDGDLATVGARRMRAHSPGSAPCRVSLADAEPGERLILVNHRH